MTVFYINDDVILIYVRFNCGNSVPYCRGRDSRSVKSIVKKEVKIMPVKTELQENKLMAYLSGDIDHHTSAEIRIVIDLEIEKLHPERIILDFSEVTFMDSSGIGLVMGRYKAAKPYGGKITVSGASQQIKKVMKLAGLERLAEIE